MLLPASSLLFKFCEPQPGAPGQSRPPRQEPAVSRPGQGRADSGQHAGSRAPDGLDGLSVRSPRRYAAAGEIVEVMTPGHPDQGAAPGSAAAAPDARGAGADARGKAAP